MTAQEFKDQLENLIVNQRKLESIQFIRQRFNIGLKECKDLVDTYWQTRSSKEVMKLIYAKLIKDYKVK